MNPVPAGAAALLVAFVLVAAVLNARTGRIPNWLTLGGVGAGVTLHALLYPEVTGLAFSLKGLAAAFGVYLVLYAFRAMGAGAVKLMAAVGALAGWENWLGILLVTTLVSVVMALFMVLTRKARETPRSFVVLLGWGFIGLFSPSALCYAPAFTACAQPLGRSGGAQDVGGQMPMAFPHAVPVAFGVVWFLAVSGQLFG